MDEGTANTGRNDMAKTIEYRQCTLRKTYAPSSSAVTVSFIPGKFAQCQRVLKLKLSDDSWDDGWVVEHVGASITDSQLPDTHAAIKSHRNATGDSLLRQS